MTSLLWLSYVPVDTGSIHVYLNGVEQYQDIDWEFLPVTNRISTTVDMDEYSDDLLEVRYAHYGVVFIPEVAASNDLYVDAWPITMVDGAYLSPDDPVSGLTTQAYEAAMPDNAMSYGAWWYFDATTDTTLTADTHQTTSSDPDQSNTDTQLFFYSCDIGTCDPTDLTYQWFNDDDQWGDGVYLQGWLSSGSIVVETGKRYYIAVGSYNDDVRYETMTYRLSAHTGEVAPTFTPLDSVGHPTAATTATLSWSAQTAGDLLVVAMSTETPDTWSPPAGWTQQTGMLSTDILSVFTRESDGTETGVTFTWSSRPWAAQAWVVHPDPIASLTPKVVSLQYAQQTGGSTYVTVPPDDADANDETLHIATTYDSAGASTPVFTNGGSLTDWSTASGGVVAMASGHEYGWGSAAQPLTIAAAPTTWHVITMVIGSS